MTTTSNVFVASPRLALRNWLLAKLWSRKPWDYFVMYCEAREIFDRKICVVAVLHLKLVKKEPFSV